MSRVTRLMKTAYSDGFVSSMRNVAYLQSSLATEPANRLKSFRRNLAITRGMNSRNYDSKVIDLLRSYANDPTDVDDQLNYLYQLKDESGFKFSRNLKIYSTTEDALRGFASSNHPYYGWNIHYRNAKMRLLNELSLSKLSPLQYYNDDDIIEAIPKLSTHSGYTYIESGRKCKGDNLSNIYVRYSELEEKAIVDGSFNRPLLIGFRTQASGEFDDLGHQTGRCKHKLRVISMVDIMVIIAELRFAKPFQSYFSQRMLYAGGKDEGQIGRIITDARNKFSAYYSIDYSRFDQSLSNWLIYDAFQIVKSCFHPMNERDESLFNVIINDFINKTFICSEGDVISHKGVPSGSMFTQIIDSICNLLMIYTFLDYKNLSGFSIVMGDDNLLFTTDSHGEDRLSEIQSYLGRLFGVTINAEKSSSGKTSEDPEFLSRYWTSYGRWRHPHQLLSRLAYPERYRNYNDDITPAHVILAFVLSYNLGMQQLIDVTKFRHDFPISNVGIFDKVDSRYLPGAMAYIREYG